MNAKTAAFRNRPSIPPAVVAAAVALTVSLGAVADAQASDYVCKSPIEGTDAVHERFDDYYDCVEPVVDEWLKQHPTEVQRLQRHYELWEFSRDHDLRDSDAAGRFVAENPVDFTERDVELSNGQIEADAPDTAGTAPGVDGAFQRFFVDRAAARMFLTTDTEGLVSFDASERYDFEFEGAVGEAGATDFYVIDEKTAVVEEPNSAGNARDLVVLDISDRSQPQEVRRLHSVLPELEGTSVSIRSVPDRPPTFDEYRAIRQGHFRVSDCGNPPSVTTYHNQHCRPDGDCFLVERHSEPTDNAICERAENRAQITHRRAAPRQRPQPREQVIGRGGRASPDGAAPQPRPEPQRQAEPQLDLHDDGGAVDMLGGEAAPAAEPVAEAEEVEESTPESVEGGDGGAGSLSQMMVHDSLLFVLTADEGEETGWLSTFDISDPRQPQPMHMIGLDNGPEAVQAHEELLLVAGRDALLVASVAVDDGPRLLGERRQRCPVNFDPVVMEGSTAYRTVIIEDRRTRCTSRLEVIDLKKPHEPQLKTTERIQRPRGLAVLGDRLFVADEPEGVRMYDITERSAPKHRHTWQMPGVKDLVISDFDLYAMTPDQVSAFYVAPLFEKGVDPARAADDITGQPAVVRGD